MFILDDDELRFYSFHLFNPLAVTKPLELRMIGTGNIQQQEFPIYAAPILTGRGGPVIYFLPVPSFAQEFNSENVF
jgi:hypothetical protein